MLLGYFDKQLSIIKRLCLEITAIDLSFYNNRFVFALKTQQFYTAFEELFKQIAKSFENHIENLDEILVRMNIEVPTVRPKIISKDSLALLEKLRAFTEFFDHAYDRELDEEELQLLNDKIGDLSPLLEQDLLTFRDYIKKLSV